MGRKSQFIVRVVTVPTGTSIVSIELISHPAGIWSPPCCCLPTAWNISKRWDTVNCEPFFLVLYRPRRARHRVCVFPRWEGKDSVQRVVLSVWPENTNHLQNVWKSKFFLKKEIVLATEMNPDINYKFGKMHLGKIQFWIHEYPIWKRKRLKQNKCSQLDSKKNLSI